RRRAAARPGVVCRRAPRRPEGRGKRRLRGRGRRPCHYPRLRGALRKEMGAASEALRGVVAAPAMPASFEALFRREYSRVGALARIDERAAALLALRYSGLSYDEIAAALGLRRSSIGTMLRRAEDAFRKEVTR